MGPEVYRLNNDQQDLRKFGYAQELFREMGGFSNFAISFSNISILTGAVTLFGYGLEQGGPLEMSLAWPVASILTLAVAASMAEMCSAFPTSGALYHWTAILATPQLAWFTAWLNIFACTASFAAINYACAQYVLPVFRIEASALSLFLAFIGICLTQGALNAYGIKATAYLNDASVTVHIIGTMVLIGALFWFAPQQPLSFLAQGTNAKGFLLGFLQAMWTISGYDASAHLAEETTDPRRHAPWGIVLSVGLSALIGYLMLIAMTLSIQQLTPGLSAIQLFQSALGERAGSAIAAMAGMAMWFCGLSALANNSRALFSLARDKGTPAHARLARIDPKHGTPAAAIWTIVVAGIALAVRAGTVELLAAMATGAFYISYGVPIYLGLRHRNREWVKEAPWNLGRHGRWINAVALAWIVVVAVISVWPPNHYSGLTLLALAVLLLAVRPRGYTGPDFARRH
jgi:amino acid transporter